MLGRCEAKTRGGRQCHNVAVDTTGFCRRHHPLPEKRPPTGTEFEVKTLTVLRLLGYRIQRNVTVNGCQIDIFGEYRTGVIPLRLMVECKDYGPDESSRD